MMKPSSGTAIRLRGVRHNNLKNFDLDIPVGKLTVVTGLSGSGKSSLAFDTLFAEGQRRYIETFSPYARQFFDRMDKPQVDRIEGIPPAIAIEQRNSVRSTRSTVGTMTELCDYMKLLWPHLARLHCKQCGQPVRKEPPQVVWKTLNAEREMRNVEVLITFDLPLSEKLSLKESLDLIARQGYQRLLVGSEIIRIDEAAIHSAFRAPCSALTVVQDRLKLSPVNRARFVEACEQAYHFGKGRLAVLFPSSGDSSSKLETRNQKLFSAGFHCATCDLNYPEPTPALFSFNHPVGACPACKGFGRIISIDYGLAIPDRSKTLAEGAVKPWQTETGRECQIDLAKACRKRRVPLDVPFAELSDEHQRWVIEGDSGYDSNDSENSWPRKWYGVKGYFRWLESKSYKMHVRVLLSRYRAYTTCADCQGRRLKPEALLYQLPIPNVQFSIGNRRSLSLADFYSLPVEQALALVDSLAAKDSFKRNDPLVLALNEVHARLRYLVEVGLGYLALDRPTRTLSGGETERVNLTTCLGTRLVNTLFVLDEPSVGLHPRDTARLVRVLEQLRDTGNTVVVVEHEASVMRAADQIVDLGPGQGEKGGEVVFCGPVKELLKSERSLTGQYLSRRKQIEVPTRRPVQIAAAEAKKLTSNPDALALNEAPAPYGALPSLTPALSPEEREKHSSHMAGPGAVRLMERNLARRGQDTSLPLSGGEGRGEGEQRVLTPAVTNAFAVPSLKITNAIRHNLKNLTVEIPLGRFVALTGVSGSGKTTLVREVLLPALEAKLKTNGPVAKASDRLAADDESHDQFSILNSQFSISGWESLSQVVLVDQSPLGKTPRSNPVVYLGAFDDVRELFAQTDLAKQRGLNGSAFSFNSGIGQCERCRGAGFEKIEMQFLSDVFIRCPECNGRRYREHILDVKLRSSRRKEAQTLARAAGHQSRSLLTPAATMLEWSIADMLEATVNDALEFLLNFIYLPAGRRALARLKLLQEVGLGYLRLGQPINTLSGGESQRLKLVSHLAESAVASEPVGADVRRLTSKNSVEEVKQWLAQRRGKNSGGTPALTPGERGKHSPPLSESVVARSIYREKHVDEQDASLPLPGGEGRGEGERISAPAHSSTSAPRRTLFLFDEPTTGLHFDDVRMLLQVFQRIVDAGHSVVVIEHNLDVIKCADWVIDLGPDAGERGGQLVVAGTPEEVAACETSYTGRFLQEILE